MYQKLARETLWSFKRNLYAGEEKVEDDYSKIVGPKIIKTKHSILISP